MEYEAIIGMEAHVQLITASKMFCRCSAAYASAAPNTHTCPVCLGMPGVLPTINRAAVEATVLTGLALNCQIPEFSKFDRKNYPYPDLPKGYQISQYDMPLCVGGWLDIISGTERKRIGIRRVHLEEDTAKLVHEAEGSLIDFNRAGVPLMEIVTEADMRSSDDAWRYLTKLRAILRYLRVSSGNMEEGAMRCEANVSVRPRGSTELGTKVEVKNLNSFRAVRQSIAYEVSRQSRLLDHGQEVHQVTMGWDEKSRKTVFQRSKEFAEDYRYFPEPDLPPLEFSSDDVERLRARLSELPDAKRERYLVDFGITVDDADLVVQDREVAEYFEDAVSAAGPEIAPQVVANWIAGEMFRLLREHATTIAAQPISTHRLASLIAMVADGTINETVARGVFEEMFATGEAAEAIVKRRGLTQISDEERLGKIVQQILDRNPEPVRQFQAGEKKVLGFLIGQAMRETKGQANAGIVGRLLQESIDRRGDRRS